MKILLATDGSPCSDRAGEEVARMPWPEDIQVMVISAMEMPVVPAIEPYGVSPDYFVELEGESRRRAQSFVDQALARLGTGENKSIKVTGEVVQGSPKQAILDYADEWGADLIVLGSHGYGMLGRFLLGSVSSAVAIHAKCSVEIVRARQEK